MSDFQKEINDFMDKVKLKNGHESEFIQAFKTFLPTRKK